MAFFRSACGGGVFAAVMGLFKLMIHQLHLALFWQHFWYSISYAMGFVGIHVTGSTLATKQPSMTAAALAGSLDINKKRARISRRTCHYLRQGVAQPICGVCGQPVVYVSGGVFVWPWCTICCWVIPLLREPKPDKLLRRPKSVGDARIHLRRHYGGNAVYFGT